MGDPADRPLRGSRPFSREPPLSTTKTFRQPPRCNTPPEQPPPNIVEAILPGELSDGLSLEKRRKPDLSPSKGLS